MDKIQPALKWLFVLLCASILPIFMFWVILTSDRDFSAIPPWAWVIIPPVPIAGMVLAFLPVERWAIATRFCLCISALHAAIMLGLVISGRWSSVAFTALFLDGFLVATLLCGPGRFTKATVLWLGLLFGVGFPIAFANGVVVAWRAEALAGDRPYCIQYASQTDAFAYEPARTLFDLSSLKMQARIMTGGSSLFHFQNHAVLIIDEGTRSFFNWSYGKEAFLDEALNRNSRNSPEMMCRPERHFAKHLPIWRHEPTRIKMSISSRHFSIPDVYRPRASGDKIIINAVPPDFAPYDGPKQPYSAQFYSNIVVAGVDAVDLSAVLKRLIESAEAKPAEPEFGLDRTQLYFGKLTNLPDRRRVSSLYTGSDGTGRLTELIDCGPKVFGSREPNFCRYQFATGGLVFNLQISDPSQWRTVEQRLTDLFASFEPRQ